MFQLQLSACCDWQDQHDGAFSAIQNSAIYATDVFHDLHEGAIKNYMDFLIRVYYKNSFISLNEQILSRNWQHGRINLFTQTNLKVSGTGMQIFEFFIQFAFLDTVIQMEDVDAWAGYVCLRKIAIFAYTVSFFTSIKAKSSTS